MSAIRSAMPAFLRTSLALMFQYRGEIILWAVWGVVYPAIAIAMWSAAVAGRADGGAIAGFGPREFAAYFLLTMVVGHVCTAWDLYEMGYLVQSGRMSARLLRPLLPIWQAIADNLAYKILTLALLIPIWVIVALVTRPAFTGDWFSTLAGVVALLIGASINFIWGYTIALGAFWLTRMDTVGECWHGMSMFLGGRIAPLTVLPMPLQWLAAFLPFKWMIWFPSAVLMGGMPRAEILEGLLLQIAWLAGGITLFRLTWRRAVKRYTAVGA